MAALLLATVIASETLGQPAAEPEASVAIGDITIAYDAARWKVTSAIPASTDAAGAERGFAAIVFHCVVRPECFDEPMVWVSVSPIDGDTGGAEDAPGVEGILRYHPRPLYADRLGGLSFSVSVTHTTCRAGTPPMYRAAAERDGFRYVLASGMAAGCSGVWGVPEHMFRELVSGVRRSLE